MDFKPLDAGAIGSPNASPRRAQSRLDTMQPNDNDPAVMPIHPPGGELPVCMEEVDEIEEGQNPEDTSSNRLSPGQNGGQPTDILPGTVQPGESMGQLYDRQTEAGAGHTERTSSGGPAPDLDSGSTQLATDTELASADSTEVENTFQRKIGGANKRWAKAHWYATQESHRRAEEDPKPAPGIKTGAVAPAPTIKGNLGKTMGNISQFMFNTPNQALLDKLEGSGSHGNLGLMVTDKGIAGVAAAAAAAAKKKKEESSGSPVASTAGSSPIKVVRPTPESAPETPLNSEKKNMSQHDEALAEYAKQTMKKHEWQWIQSKGYLYCIFVCTIYILFAEDIYILVDPDPSNDLSIYSVSAACFFFFLVDLIARAYLEDKYFNSLYFWLDTFAVISLAPSLLYVISDDLFLDDKTGISGLRSGRAASSGSRIARFVRVLQLASRVTQNAKIPSKFSLNISAMHSQTISDMAAKIDFHIAVHVIVAIASMLIIMTGLTFLEPDDSIDQLKLQLRTLVACDASDEATQLAALRETALPTLMSGLKDLDKPLIYLNLGGHVLYGSAEDKLQLRSFPKQYITTDVDGLAVGDGTGHIEVEDKESSQALAKTNLILVNCVIFVLAAMAAVMSSSVRQELLRPIERIVDTMEQLTKAPLSKKLDRKMSLKAGALLPVEHTLQKVGQLLQLGFGEAGAKIISTNLTNGTMDTSIAGRLIHGIFGFCDIRNFTDCTEVLKADIVKLVNITAKYVHDAVIDNHGAPNKNIGDAFLLIWKPKGDLDIEAVADSALCSYIRIIIDTARSKSLMKYEKRHEIQDRMPGFRVKMGFGLHYGWAIEGAIGSQHKIDASYLSPHVNLASRLEAATKQYGAQILLSEDFVVLLSEYAQTQVRLLDRVTVKGSNKPIELYTYDVPMLQCRGGTLVDEITTATADSTKTFLQSFPPCISEDFRKVWDRAIGNYLGGSDGSKANWKATKALLDTCQHMIPEDGPTKALQNVIAGLADADGNAPADWAGFRALTDK